MSLSEGMMLLDQAPQPLLDDMGIDLRRGDVRMAKQLLHGAQIGAAFQQVTGKSVAEDMRRDPCRFKPGGDGERLQFLPEALARQMLTSA